MEFDYLFFILLPIICNGVLIFVIQSHFSQKIERETRNSLRLITTIENFRNKIYEATTILAEFSREQTIDQVNNNLEKLLIFFAKRFCPFYDNNKNTLQPNKVAIEQLISLYRELIVSVKNEDISQINVQLNNIKDTFNVLSDELETRLNKM